MIKIKIERQDMVDNACHALLKALAPEGAIVAWNIEHLSTVRDAVQEVLVGKLQLMSEVEFYPYEEGI